MSSSLAGVCEKPCRFNDNVCAVVSPGYFPRVTLSEDPYFLPVNYKTIVSSFYLPGIDAVVTVIFEQMGIGSGIGEVIHRHHFHLIATSLNNCLQS